jgi:predicted neuraminidase
MKLLLVNGLLFAAVASAAQDVPFEVREQSLVFEHTATDRNDPGNLSGFNHAPNVAHLPDGRIMAVWFSAPFEGSPKQRILSSFSTDGGRSWSPAEVLQDTPGRADFDPALLVADGKTFLFFAIDEPLGVHFKVSHDSGRTWSPPADLGQRDHTTRSNGIRLRNGELLFPLHRRGTKGAGVMKSTDEGRTWRRCGNVTNPDGQGGEPTIAQTASGDIHMILRTKDGEVWRSISRDHGESLSKPEKTGLVGTASAHHLLALRDGRLVLTHNPVKPPHRFPLTMRLSGDDGLTWSSPLLLADRPEKVGGWQTSYPSVVELPDGALLALWTQIRGTAELMYGDIRSARVEVLPAAKATPPASAPVPGPRPAD